MSRLFVLLSAVCLFMGCHKDVVFSDAVSFNGNQWSDDVKFDVSVKDTVNPVDFYIFVGNTNEYQFSNLYLFLKTYYPDGNVSIDTIECRLADNYGEWLGNGINIKNNDFVLKRNVLFPMKGNYVFEFEQAMRVNPLNGIAKFGIKIANNR